jgi:SAM-dependent methyltransferase
VAEAPSDRLRDVYERRAEVQYPDAVALPDPRLDRKFERMFELLRERLPVDSMLDAGCGDGRYLAALGRAGLVPRRLVGSDISERILETARVTAAAHGVEAELVRANLEQLPFPDGERELVLCVQVVEHLLDPAAGFRELARVLRPGGTLLLSTDNARNRITQAVNLPRTAVVRGLGLSGRRRKVEFPHVAFHADAVAHLVRQAGLELERLETFRFHLDPPLDRAPVRRVLNRLDRMLPDRGWGDLIAVVARKPPV